MQKSTGRERKPFRTMRCGAIRSHIYNVHSYMQPTRGELTAPALRCLVVVVVVAVDVRSARKTIHHDHDHDLPSQPLPRRLGASTSTGSSTVGTHLGRLERRRPARKPVDDENDLLLATGTEKRGCLAVSCRNSNLSQPDFIRRGPSQSGRRANQREPSD